METLREHKSAVADEFSTMVRILARRDFESGLNPIRSRLLTRHALGLARFVVGCLDDQTNHTLLREAYIQATVRRPDLEIDIYRTLLATRAVRAVALREILGLRLHGPIRIPRAKT